ncbi:MAG: hypothetical protein H0U35_03205, partial [Sporichthyaceae bacterium]|nr:hypothetical protein [Sporichthyaceae bacterium]
GNPVPYIVMEHVEGSTLRDLLASGRRLVPERALEIVAADYLGRPLDDVRAELEELGLRVDVVHTAGGGTVGTVKDVAPTGVVAADSVVRLTVVAAKEDEGSEAGEDREDREDDDKPGKGKGKGRG